MQAIMVSERGGPEVLRAGETDIPRPGRGEVLVRVLAAGVGPWDASLRRGGWSGPWPYIPGAEFAGLVEGHSGDEAGFARRYYWQDAAAAHREIEKGHTRGKLVLVVDEDLAATMEL